MIGVLKNEINMRIGFTYMIVFQRIRNYDDEYGYH